VAIYRLLQNMPLAPERIAVLQDAYERTLKALGLVDRADPVTEIVAKKIIEIGQFGLRDAADICARATKELGFD
jgi:hypothetical protein